MSFYTNVLRYKNYILHRGYYDNGERFSRKEYFQPKMFVSSKNKTEWTGLDGQSVAPIDFESMFEAGQWLKQNIDVSGRNIYGNKKTINLLKKRNNYLFNSTASYQPIIKSNIIKSKITLGKTKEKITFEVFSIFK